MIGYHFFDINGFYWRHLERALVPLSMPHIDPEVTERDVKKILKQQGAYLIRWDTGFDRYETSEWWHIIKDEPEDISSLNKKTRYMIRQGAKLFDVRLCDRDYIASNAYHVYEAAFARYKTFDERYSFQDFKLNIIKLPIETEFWGVFDRKNDQLVAFSENLVREDACFYSSMWFEPESMKKFSGYVLFHEMNNYYLNNKKLKYVSDGARSISHQTNIHAFLVSKFGFRKAYSKLEVAYRFGLYPMIWCLYPFRKWLKGDSSEILKKVSVLLEQERIRRSCENLVVKLG